MTLLTWGPTLALGVAAMDAEHQELLAAMNRIHELDQKKAGNAAVDVAIQHLIKVTEKHFADEERYMASIGYADLKRHSLVHKDMLRRVAEQYAAFAKGDGSVPQSFYDFLVHWLTAHIKGIDKKYATAGKPAKV